MRVVTIKEWFERVEDPELRAELLKYIDKRYANKLAENIVQAIFFGIDENKIGELRAIELYDMARDVKITA